MGTNTDIPAPNPWGREPRLGMMSGPQSSRVDSGSAVLSLGNMRTRKGNWGRNAGVLGSGETPLLRFAASEASATQAHRRGRITSLGAEGPSVGSGPERRPTLQVEASWPEVHRVGVCVHMQKQCRGTRRNWWACPLLFCPFPFLACAEVSPPFSLLAGLSGGFYPPPLPSCTSSWTYSLLPPQ